MEKTVLDGTDLMTFPWEKETERKEEETITADELRKRCERAKAQWGLK